MVSFKKEFQFPDKGRLLDESREVGGGLNGLGYLIGDDRRLLRVLPIVSAAAANPRRRQACHRSLFPYHYSKAIDTLTRRDMAESLGSLRPLFGGALNTAFPNRFQDVSNVRQVPDHQEVFVDPSRDESLIFELLELKHDVGDQGSAAWFLQDLAAEQDAGQCELIEQSGVIEAPWLVYQSVPAVITTAIAQMAISKGRQGREAQNVVRVYLANLRLKEVNTDMLITAYEPILINPLSESATVVGSGFASPAAQAGVIPMAEVFKLAVSSFKVHDWSLFGNV